MTRGLPTLITGLAALLLSTGTALAAGNAVPVTTRALADVLFYPVRDAPATAVSLNDSRVAAEQSGVLQDISVKVGDSVQKGDPVAQLDCRDYQIARQEAAAALVAARAQATYDRSQFDKARKLSQNGSISREEHDRRQSAALSAAAGVDQLQASADAARRAVEKCVIPAPFDAVVVERIASKGDYLVPGTPVLRLLDRGNVEVDAQVQVQDVESLASAANLAFVVGESRFPLTVRTVLPLVDSQLRSREVRLEFSAEAAIPGSAGRIQWALPTLHVPPEYLVRRGESLGIFVKSGDEARFVALAGARDGQPAAYPDPQAGTLLIVDGRFGMKDGDSLRVVER
jgi:RND family efflux transporter MFP subunit